jgi:signal transduction histidine kinase
MTTTARQIAVAETISYRRGRGPGRAWVSAAIATLGLLAAVWFSFVELPSAVTFVEDSTGIHVAAVGMGSGPWLEGVRPGLFGERVGTSIWVRVSDHAFGVSAAAKGDFPIAVSAGALLLATSFVLRLAKLPGSAAAAGAGVAVALSPVLPALGLPASAPLALLSTGTAIAASRVPDRRWQRAFDFVGLAVVGLILVASFLLMREAISLHWDWVWMAPLGIAIAIGVIGEILATGARLTHMPANGETRASRLLQALVPLAARSRIEGADEERSRLAIEIHNSVLPKVRSSARAVRNDATPEEAALHIERLEAELRDVMTRYETVTLELGGVADALRVFAESLDTGGIKVSLDTSRVTAKRPPANVEMAAYRIGQAAIENSIRHSGADHIEITVATAADRTELTITDDGVGIDSTAEGNARRSGHLGLSQMRVRAEAVGGKLEVHGKPGDGTHVRFTWAG